LFPFLHSLYLNYIAIKLSKKISDRVQFELLSLADLLTLQPLARQLVRVGQFLISLASVESRQIDRYRKQADFVMTQLWRLLTQGDR
jgi:hypothetical protein